MCLAWSITVLDEMGKQIAPYVLSAAILGALSLILQWPKVRQMNRHYKAMREVEQAGTRATQRTKFKEAE